jgi:hypothetical protein
MVASPVSAGEVFSVAVYIDPIGSKAKRAVIPAKAGIQRLSALNALDPSFRWDDSKAGLGFTEKKYRHLACVDTIAPKL